MDEGVGKKEVESRLFFRDGEDTRGCLDQGSTPSLKGQTGNTAGFAGP